MQAFMAIREKVYHLNDSYQMLEGEKEGYLKPYEVQLFVKNVCKYLVNVV